MKFSMNIFWLAKLGRMTLDRHALYEIPRAMLFTLINNPHAALKNFAGDFVMKIVLDCEQ